MFLGDVGSCLNEMKHYTPFQKIEHHLAMMDGVQTTNMICLNWFLGFPNRYSAGAIMTVVLTPVEKCH